MSLPVIPIDTHRLLNVLCVSAPVPRSDRDTGVAKIDRISGQPEYLVGVLAKIPGDRRAFVIDVRVPGEPAGLVEGQPVVLYNLTGSPWEQNGRSGVSYRADAITPATPSTPPASVSAPAGDSSSGAGRAAGKAGGGS